MFRNSILYCKLLEFTSMLGVAGSIIGVTASIPSFTATIKLSIHQQTANNIVCATPSVCATTDRLAFVCPRTITAIDHCDSILTCMYVIILKYISTTVSHQPFVTSTALITSRCANSGSRSNGVPPIPTQADAAAPLQPASHNSNYCTWL